MQAPMKPNVEVIGPWIPNRGDEMMLWAVARHFGDRAHLGVSSNMGLDQFPDAPPLYKIKWEAGAGDVLNEVRRGKLGEAARLCRDNVLLAARSDDALLSRGWMSGRQINLLVDCSGYGYGDLWSLHRKQIRAEYYAKLKRQGAKVILLPQAFGPFERPEIREAAIRIFAQCDLVFARDKESRQHILRLGLKRLDEIPVAPDITHLLKGDEPTDHEAWSKRIIIVPNTRMLDRTPDAIRASYPGFMARAIRLVKQHGLEPVLMVHEDNDLPLVRKLFSEPGCECRIVHGDALPSKGMLGAARGVIASRYHACVSALSQGVPTIGTSWIFKYDVLFNDYGCADLLISPDSDPQVLENAMTRLVEPSARDRLASDIAAAAERQKMEVRAMWTKVDALFA